MSAPDYNVNNSSYHNVGAAVNALDTGMRDNAAEIDIVQGKAANAASSVASGLGGGATYDPVTGKVLAPVYSVSNSSYSNVGDAVEVLDKGMRDNAAEIETVQGKAANAASSIASGLGGGATYDPVTGKVLAPVYSVSNSSYRTVGDAVNALDSGVQQNTTAVTKIQNSAALRHFHVQSTKGRGQATGVDSMAIGPEAKAQATNAIAMGTGAAATDTDSLAIGTQALAAGEQSVAIGYHAVAAGGKAVSIGSGNQAYGNGAVAIGDPNYVSGDGSFAGGADNIANNDGTQTITAANQANGAVAIGNRNIAIGQGSVALGATSQANAAGAVALGDTAIANTANGVALGSGAYVSGNNSVALGAGSSD
ncbi:hypothetical protein DB43_CH00010, partial [Parachlamydia acanthamoebae]